MSEHTTSVRYKVGIEGADESLNELQGVMRATGSAIRLVTSLDYTWISWQRTVQEFNIPNFARSLLSTISLIQTLISVTKAAEAAQMAYNAALIIGRLLEGPRGWLILGGAAVGVGGALLWLSETRTRLELPTPRPYTTEEQLRRELYRQVVPG